MARLSLSVRALLAIDGAEGRLSARNAVAPSSVCVRNG